MPDLASALMNKPVPGQSLTRNPDSRAPYERPPASTELAQVTRTLFSILTRDEMLQSLADTFNKGSGTDIDRLAGVILHEAFANGKISPDLAILAVEPCIEILMFICSILDVPVQFSSDDKETDWTGTLKVASKQAKRVGASSPATLQEWLSQNEQQMVEPVTKKEVKKAVSLLAPKGGK